MELAAEPRPWQRIALRAREVHHVMHREEEGFIAAAASISSSSFSIRPRSAAGAPAGQCCAAPSSTSLRSQLAGGFALGHDLARVLIAQLLQREAAARCNGRVSASSSGWIQPRQFRHAAQVPFTVGEQPASGLHGA